ncbi:3-hydroxyacyl-CoA dehydrogenase [Salicibibacter cibarius]|uniref:L-gulonate 3-dehydrogenase n=1 Tax=Salicibibacter cibarius TaxID=2743000 RepID=A0A7T7C9Z9_9BACI|nr:3-hydroxyacyl-CoA dehydrogenase NAD-binding domain-containing protein [Salicibibacter cibarius]QQK74387.1 3-hydroxyacyl-CoA dehydrogenase [Salicibibacter cibarius]
MKSSENLIAIAGIGRMGRGIALTFAYQGYDVILIDLKKREYDEFRQLKSNSLNDIWNQLDVLVLTDIVSKESVSGILERIKFISIDDKAQDLWKQADILFEALPEKLDLKRNAFANMVPLLSKRALVASTTSTFSVNDLSSYIVEPERYMNTHWLNPAYLHPLIEISVGSKTSDEYFQTMSHLLEKVGKVPVKCSPSPGFIVPRIQALAMNEAARLVDEDVASIEDIDKASRIGLGLRFAVFGLLEFADWGGADTLFHASNYLKDSLQDNRFEPPENITEKMDAGEIGMKANKGFYSFDERTINEYQITTLKKFIDLLKHLGFLGDKNIHNESSDNKDEQKIINKE